MVLRLGVLLLVNKNMFLVWTSVQNHLTLPLQLVLGELMTLGLNSVKNNVGAERFHGMSQRKPAVL